MSLPASQCAELVNRASAGVSPALRAVDCMAGEMAAGAFDRLFGAHGSMAPVLTMCLTLYIAFFALSLLTGRASLGVSALTPRMLTLGLVLTFATSWIAYSQVLWNLAVAGPDWIAGVAMGTAGAFGGSATQLFADRIDIVFAAVAAIGEAASQAGGGDAAAATGAGAAGGGMFRPADIMWLGAVLLLLGTVGVLLAARIALAVLVATGPVFVVLALFSGTRGLTAGWLRAVALCALAPLFVVLGGSITLELLAPVIAGLAEDSIDGIAARGALALFVIACVHVALMMLALKLATGVAMGWRVFGLTAGADRPDRGFAASGAVPGQIAAAAPASLPAAAAMAHRPVAVAAFASDGASPAGGEGPRAVDRRTYVTQVAGGGIEPLAAVSAARARGVGSRFRSASNDRAGKAVKEMIK